MENINNTQESNDTLKEDTNQEAGEGQVNDAVKSQDVNEKLVEELKDLRKKNAELRGKLEGNSEVEKPKVDPSNIAEAVKQALAEEKKLESEMAITSAKESALNKFKELNPLYNSSNDPDGTKFKVIENEFKNFNLSNAKSEEDFATFLNKAAVIAGVDIKEEAGSVSTPSHSPTPGSTPGVANTGAVASLSKEDKAKAQAKGYTEERYAELKAKFPNLV